MYIEKTTPLYPQFPKNCTSQQKVDTFFPLYTLKTGHSTPGIVLASGNLVSTQDVPH